MPSDSWGFSMRVITGKAITELDCFLQKVRLYPMSQHDHLFYSMYTSDKHTHTPVRTHTDGHLISCICFVFRRCIWRVCMCVCLGVGGFCLLCSLYLSKLDAGSRCLSAPVKLWCDCPILGSTHLMVLTVIILKEGRRDWLNGSVRFSGSSPGQWCPDQWRVEDGWRVRERDLTSPHFQSHIPEGMVLPDEWSLLRRRS